MRAVVLLSLAALAACRPLTVPNMQPEQPPTFPQPQANGYVRTMELPAEMGLRLTEDYRCDVYQVKGFERWACYPLSRYTGERRIPTAAIEWR